MANRFVAMALALVFIIGLSGCGEEIDPEEQNQAENLIEGLNILVFMTNVDEYSGYKSASPGFKAPPFGWTGPNGYPVPEGEDTLYYEFAYKIPLDSTGITIDSLLFLLMFTPDIWDSLYQDSIPTQMDVWVIGMQRPQIYFHTVVVIPDTVHVTGSLKWNWEETFYSYEYNRSRINYADTVDITTSENIGLSAYFRLNADGSGSEAANYAEWNNTAFVRFEFFEYNPNDEYNGYYTLLSEAWEVRHYFKLKDKLAV